MSPRRDILRPALPSHRRVGMDKAVTSISDEARRIVEELRPDIGGLHLAGHSYGGAVALRIALDYPHLVRSLTLIEPAAFHLLRNGAELERKMFADVERLAAPFMVSGHGTEAGAGVARFVEFWCGTGSWGRLSACKRVLVAAQSDIIRRNFGAIFAEGIPLSTCALISCPILGVVGENSPCLAQHLTRLIVGQVVEGRVIAISGAGHMSLLTHPKPIATAMSHHIVRSEAWRSSRAHAA
jgi:pimeloyl-ACP methyl ester carboxylesterase